MTTKSELIAALAAQAYAILKDERVDAKFPLPAGMLKFRVIYLASQGDTVLPSSAEIVVKDLGLPTEEAKWLGGSPITTKNQLYEDIINSAPYKNNHGRIIRSYQSGFVVSILKDTNGDDILDEIYKFVDRDAQNNIRMRDLRTVIRDNVV